MSRIESVFLFDLDGTLIDSVYQHVLAWREALDREGIDLSVWRIHRRIGMSGGLFTNMLLRETGLEISPERVERLRRGHAEAYARHCHQVRPLPGARELLDFLTKSESPWAVATSGVMETAKLNLDALGIDPAVVPVVTRDQVKFAKPDPDLFLAAAERLGAKIEQLRRDRRFHLGYAGCTSSEGAWRRTTVRRLRPGGTRARWRGTGLRRSR
jgi:beta-phosphoglucomutase-like phosphatase (HAD superfamily)